MYSIKKILILLFLMQPYLINACSFFHLPINQLSKSETNIFIGFSHTINIKFYHENTKNNSKIYSFPDSDIIVTNKINHNYCSIE